MFTSQRAHLFNLRQLLILVKLLALFLFLCPKLSWATPAVLSSLDPQRGTISDEYQLKISVSASERVTVKNPRLESVKGFEISLGGTERSTQFVNGDVSNALTFVYSVQPSAELKPGKYRLGGGTVDVNGQEYEIPQSSLEITDSASDDEQQQDGAKFAQTVSNYSPFVGEQVIYKAEALTDQSFAQGQLGDLPMSGFWRESLGQYAKTERLVGGTVIHSQSEAIFPTDAGDLTIPERNLSVEYRVANAQQRWSLFDETFPGLGMQRNFRLKRKELKAPALKLSVRALPKPPQEINYAPPVGNVSLNADIDRNELKATESLTLKVVLSGTANLRSFKLPELKTDDFKVYPEEPQFEAVPTNAGVLFRKTFSIALLPKRSAQLSVPAIEILSFNPQTEKYQTLKTPSFEVNVTGEFPQQALPAPAPQASPQLKSEKQEVIPAQQNQPEQNSAENLAVKLRALWKFVYLNQLAILAAVLALLISVLAYRRLKSVNPEKARINKAGNLALAQLAELEKISEGVDAQKILEILREFLRLRFSLPLKSITSVELKEHLTGKVPLYDLEKLEAYLRNLEGIVYGGQLKEETKSRLLFELKEIIALGLK